MCFQKWARGEIHSWKSLPGVPVVLDGHPHTVTSGQYPWDATWFWSLRQWIGICFHFVFTCKHACYVWGWGTTGINNPVATSVTVLDHRSTQTDKARTVLHGSIIRPHPAKRFLLLSWSPGLRQLQSATDDSGWDQSLMNWRSWVFTGHQGRLRVLQPCVLAWVQGPFWYTQH